MSAFSRGFLFRHQCAFKSAPTLLFSSPRSFQHPRFISSAAILRSAKKSRSSQSIKYALPKTKAGLEPAKAKNTTYQSYATTLAQKAHPTLLYQAPSHTVLMISSYSAALFCFSYAAVSYWANYLNAPPDIATWVPIAFGGISIMMAAFGSYLVLGPARIIRTITAIPKNLNTAVAVVGKTTSDTVPELVIEIELRRMLPFPLVPARKIYAKPEEITLPSPLVPPPNRNLTVEEQRMMRHHEEAEKKRLLEYERSHIMTAPFRHASMAFYNLFKSMGRAWNREGFLKMNVKGRQYKLDTTGGWVLDGGKAIDRLVVLKPTLL